MLIRTAFEIPSEPFDPYIQPFIPTAWHVRFIRLPAPDACMVYGREEIVKAGGDCCIWQGWNNGKGYGIAREPDTGRRTYVHRYVFQRFHKGERAQLARNRPPLPVPRVLQPVAPRGNHLF